MGIDLLVRGNVPRGLALATIAAAAGYLAASLGLATSIAESTHRIRDAIRLPMRSGRELIVQRRLPNRPAA
jgi:hypothetical protein